jgi:CDP-2,3-bis-(O-geranylgeranyl)-sn-glycerol synthase
MVILAAEALYLLVPLLVSAVLAGVIHRYDLWTCLKRPLDGGMTVGGRRLFGDHKTWRGAACAVVSCFITVLVQKHIVGDMAGAIAVTSYNDVNAVGLGAAMGIGATIGELPNSFVKRKIGVAPGTNAHGVLAVIFYIRGQVDLLFTTWPLLLFWVRPGWYLVMVSFVLVPAVHQLVSAIGYLIGARASAR